MLSASVETLRCNACIHELSHLVFAADTDMATAGLASLCCKAGNEVIALQLTADEMGSTTTDTLVERISTQLGRDDLCHLAFVGATNISGTAGESFAAFRARWQPPVARYACPFCRTGEMVQVYSSTVADFVAQGGKVTDLTGMFAGD